MLVQPKVSARGRLKSYLESFPDSGTILPPEKRRDEIKILAGSSDGKIWHKAESFRQRLLGHVKVNFHAALVRSTGGLPSFQRHLVRYRRSFAGSSNGRTTVSGAVYRGSSPCPAANLN